MNLVSHNIIIYKSFNFSDYSQKSTLPEQLAMFWSEYWNSGNTLAVGIAVLTCIQNCIWMQIVFKIVLYVIRISVGENVIATASHSNPSRELGLGLIAIQQWATYILTLH
jgi:hypothetical protein